MGHVARLTFLISLLLPLPAVGLAYRCSDGPRVVLAQFPCGPDAEPVTPRATVTLPLAPLTAAEHARLKELAAKLASTRANAAERRSRAAARHAREQDERERRCGAARRKLEQLASTRRSGYSLPQAARLDAEREALKAEVRAAC